MEKNKEKVDKWKIFKSRADKEKSLERINTNNDRKEKTTYKKRRPILKAYASTIGEEK